MDEQDRTIGIGVIGAGWLGDVHARAWGRLRHHYPELAVQPRFAAVADSVAASRDLAVRKHGFERAYAEWRELLEDPDVDVVSVTAPNALHREVGVAVAEAGKHLWIEKPVGLTPDDARTVAAAVEAAGVQGAVGFNYRAVPAVTHLRELVASGAIGRPTHARVQLLTDYAAHPLGLLTWRFTLAAGGHGVLGDLASHGVDLVRFVLGDVERLVAETAVFLEQRPVLEEGAVSYGHGLGDASSPTGHVENEDYVAALLRTATGALVTLECSRVATGEQNSYGIEVHGTEGVVGWDFRTPGELRVSSGTAYADQPAQRLLVGPGAGDYARFQPGAGIGMSYDDTKVIELAGLVRSVLTGTPEGPVLADAVASAEALDAMVRSAAGRGWVDLRSPVPA
ncbi:Gfo/Idh/MocA family protein [Nocardioides taihuensis]|uniref:Gfo/Idh/MocA family protein n=1 Tax=Nocardioides taihuensis TaxID=1835606 RepID=A0ABW0BF38_9ACTN